MSKRKLSVFQQAKPKHRDACCCEPCLYCLARGDEAGIQIMRKDVRNSKKKQKNFEKQIKELEAKYQDLVQLKADVDLLNK